ncbi:hypothetical protein J437_LFUL005105 [Ladona fulva]|uniref:Mos1 transposase HTH domain-containing protein n=1 Tax=Ladona fulva TaxID=123851 RepID=A0A8K0JYE7_LADFU|nr:hypothetical protein J437_LFUL005105 [Ladona fulva]
MAAPLNMCTTIEQHGIVLFLWPKNMTAKDIHKEMLAMYSEHCLSCQAIHNWVQKFSEGRTMEISMPEMLQRVEDIVRADRRVTIDAVATAIGCSHGQAYNMMHEGLGFHKAPWCKLHTVSVARVRAALRRCRQPTTRPFPILCLSRLTPLTQHNLLGFPITSVCAPTFGQRKHTISKDRKKHQRKELGTQQNSLDHTLRLFPLNW